MCRKLAVLIPLLTVIIGLTAKLYSQSPGELKTKEENPVYFGVIPRDNPRITYEKYQPIIDYLSESTPYTFELDLRKTYLDTVAALGSGETDVAFLGPLTYLHAHADYGAVPILKSITKKGKPYYKSVVVTKESNPIKHLSELKGKSVAFSSLKSTSGNLIPRYVLANAGIHVKELRRHSQFDYQDSVVKWVLKGEYDAGTVRESVAEKYVPLGLKIISISDPIPTGPVVAGPKTSMKIIEVIRNTLLNMKNTAAGKEALKKVDVELRDGFIAARDSDYEHIRRMINAVPTGCGIGCHPKIKKL
ncbi:MAG: phosphate/phosphite/phosphonate ABC transporter substrate-binding protein [Nitrospiraceae bacterium]|jgi:phosphonate transport system substrate-binding protein|nr:MAG: phosphate/phosphite/phosphonate ABC transporter substrate-binding protein [Nitrospiraceae bacterium]